MIISQENYPNATLVEDRKGFMQIIGAGNSVLSRNESAVTFGRGVTGFRFMHWHFVGLHGGTRVARFFQALPAVWRFCK